MSASGAGLAVLDALVPDEEVLEVAGLLLELDAGADPWPEPAGADAVGAEVLGADVCGGP